MPTEANEAVTEALEGWVASLPFDGDGGPGVMGDWIAVLSMVDVRADGTPMAQYYIAMKDGTMLPHIAGGLLRQGLIELEVG